jgi:prephenate dehydrogenase
MKKVAIIGPGLLGASLAMTLKKQGESRVTVWARRAEAIEELLGEGHADEGFTDVGRSVADADCVVMCTPIGAMRTLAPAIAQGVRPGALVTDVGSVKMPVVHELAALFHPRARFVSSHPMAGSEQSVMKAARADLFEGAVCILTPTESADPLAIDELKQFWRKLGCTVRQLSPAEHDEVVALISHLPHLLAAALVTTVGERGPDAIAFAGPGFRDTTRVAGGPPAMWSEILRSNQVAVRKSTEAMIEKLRQIIKLLDATSDSAMHAFLTQAKAERDRLPPLV